MMVNSVQKEDEESTVYEFNPLLQFEEEEVNERPLERTNSSKSQDAIVADSDYNVIYRPACISIRIFNLGRHYFNLFLLQIFEYGILFFFRYNDTLNNFIVDHYIFLSLILINCYGTSVIHYIFNKISDSCTDLTPLHWSYIAAEFVLFEVLIGAAFNTNVVLCVNIFPLIHYLFLTINLLLAKRSITTTTASITFFISNIASVVLVESFTKVFIESFCVYVIAIVWMLYSQLQFWMFVLNEKDTTVYARSHAASLYGMSFLTLVYVMYALVFKPLMCCFPSLSKYVNDDKKDE